MPTLRRGVFTACHPLPIAEPSPRPPRPSARRVRRRPVAAGFLPAVPVAPPAPAGSLPAAGPRAVAGTAPGQVGTGGTAAGEAAPVVAVLAVEQPVPDPLAEGLPAGGLPAERAELRPPVQHRRVAAPSRCAPRRAGRAASAARPAHAASAAGDAA